MQILESGQMDYDPETCHMRLKVVHPGVSIDEVKANTGFDLLIPEQVAVNEPSSDEELHLLREEIDRQRFYI